MVINFLAAFTIFLALVTLASWALGRRERPAEARVRALARQRRLPGRDLDLPLGQRLVLPAVEGLTRSVLALLPPAFIARTRRRLVVAGNPMPVQGFFAMVLVLGTILPAAYFLLLWVGSRGAPAPAALLLVPILAIVGTGMPFLWLWRRARARQLAIWKELPDGFDLITTCVEAGLGLDAAFQRVADRLKGPFTEEIAQMLREVGMGRPRREALLDLANRTEVEDLQTFAQAVIQAEQLGTSLGRVLRTQAHRLRVRRRQRAEEMARQAPVKMAFPLVLCLLPSLFIVTIGPVALSLIRALEESR